MTVRRRGPDRNSGWTRLHADVLLSGHTFFGEFVRPGADPRDGAESFDMADVRAAWRALRRELLPAFIEKHPGTRPWAWWILEAPEPRRIVHPADVTGWEPMGSTGYFGMAAKFNLLPEASHRMGPTDLHLMYESESDYLERLGLLTEAEMSGQKH